MSGGESDRDEKVVEVFIDRLQRKKAPATAEKRRSHVGQFREWLAERDTSLCDVGRFDVEDHFDDVRDDHPDKYALDRLDCIHAFFSWLQDGGRERLEQRHDIAIDRNDNPASGILEAYEDIDYRPKKATIYEHDIVALTRDEAAKLVDRENAPEPKTRNQLILKLFVQTGMRVSEIREIRLRDIDRDQRRIGVRDQKNSRRRTVFYQPSLDRLLDRWIDGGLRDTHGTAAESDYLLLTYKKPQMSTDAVGDVVDKAARNAGIQEEMYVDAAGNSRWKVTPHTLRHSYARFAVTGENSMDISRLARLMGHLDKEGNPNISTTKKYLAFTEQDLKDASKACIPDI